MSNEERPTTPEDYEPPKVDVMPTEDGPAVTAAGDSPPSDSAGAEWRPE
jgi:hypothetical protein